MTYTREQIAAAWHDVSCPEGPGCEDRAMHLIGQPLVSTGILERFVEALEADAAARSRRERGGATPIPAGPLPPASQTIEDEEDQAWQPARLTQVLPRIAELLAPTSAEPAVGSRWIWEPYKPGAREEVVVISVFTNEDDETWVRTQNLRTQMIAINSLDRFIEACVPYKPWWRRR